MRKNDVLNRLIAELSSLKITLLCLALLMILVVACTLAQVNLGIHLSVERYIRSFIVWWSPEGSALRLPVFPGGGLGGGRRRSLGFDHGEGNQPERPSEMPCG